MHVVKEKTHTIHTVHRYSKQTWDRMKKYMRNVVSSSHGTGNRANPGIPGLNIAGKTGTAQNPHGEPHAWFIGYGEKNKKRVSVVVLLENGGHGGVTAAPIAGRIFESLFSSNENMNLAFSL